MSSRVHLKPKTLAGYRSLLDTQVLPTWGTTPLAAVTHAKAQAWVASLRANGLSASRTRQAAHLLGSMLDAAVRDRRLASNPAAKLDLPKMPKTQHRYLDHSDLEALAEASGDYRALVLLLGVCGLRWGEATALRVRHVDLLRRRLRVVEAVGEVGGQLVVGPPKTHHYRTVAIPKFLAEELRPHLAGRVSDDLVFPAKGGGHVRNAHFRRTVWDRACVSLGLGNMEPREGKPSLYRGLVIHELRHTAASLMIRSGASVKAVQTSLGHATATMTLDLYGHLFPDELDALADRLDAARETSVGEMWANRQGVVVPLQPRAASLLR